MRLFKGTLQMQVEGDVIAVARYLRHVKRRNENMGCVFIKVDAITLGARLRIHAWRAAKVRCSAGRLELPLNRINKRGA